MTIVDFGFWILDFGFWIFDGKRKSEAGGWVLSINSQLSVISNGSRGARKVGGPGLPCRISRACFAAL